ncbi:MAG TPA: helicase c2, partial [Armatimonadetes bacterium]|nr:helicase c2 [Armatimonadota bacterium]
TKTLQQQLVEKDLPFLHEVMDGSFRYAVAYGSQNFVCLRRLQRAYQYSLPASVEEVAQLTMIREWARETKTGLRMELEFEPSKAVWSMVSRDSDLCIGTQCPHYSQCPYQRARREQLDAHILVVNHHLFFANIATDGNLLPTYDAVIFDEAHNLEEVACSYLADEFSNTKLDYFLNQLMGRRGDRGLLLAYEERYPELVERARMAIEDAHRAAEFLFREVQERMGDQSIFRLRERGFISNVIRDPLAQLSGVLKELSEKLSNGAERAELEAMRSRADEMNALLQNILDIAIPGFVYWIEAEALRREPRIALCMAPIDLADLLSESVFINGMPIVLTSATLTTAGSFDFLRERLGIRDAVELVVESPFQFDEQALVYIAHDLPDPALNLKHFTEQAVERVIDILRITGGATFVLFTSYPALRYARQRLSEALPKMTLFVQGEMPRGKMLDEFKVTENAVLLGTNTFWQGVDVPGEALIAVIIVKLPFAVPDHPIVEARIERLREEGKDPFRYYQLPQAIIWLRQGFGRLVRTKEDYGIVAILDPRILTRGYGQQFLRSLPRCRFTQSLDEVRKFLEDHNNDARHKSAFDVC